MITITVDTHEVAQAFSNMGKVSQWLPPAIDIEMLALGSQVIPIMRGVLNANRYRGTLADSVGAEYNSVGKILAVGPNAKRRGWDAGMIFEVGTSGGHAIPWKPIKEWGAFRGLSARQSWAVLKKLRQSGVSAHPFLMKVLEHPSFGKVLEDTAQRLGVRISALAVAGGNPIGLAEAS